MPDVRLAARLAREVPAAADAGIAGSGALLGLLAGAVVLAVAIGLGGRADAFIDTPALLIVVGGTLAVLCVCFSPGEVAAMVGCVAASLLARAPDPRAAALRALRLAEDARRFGVLHFEQKAVLQRWSTWYPGRERSASRASDQDIPDVSGTSWALSCMNFLQRTDAPPKNAQSHAATTVRLYCRRGNKNSGWSENETLHLEQRLR